MRLPSLFFASVVLMVTTASVAADNGLQAGVSRVDITPNRKPLALLANYAMHATVLGGSSTLVSGDAPGIVAGYVEERTGATMLYLNGAAGNIAPIYSVRSSNELRLLDQFKVLLGDPILEAHRRVRPDEGEVKLQASLLTVETPKRPEIGWSKEMGDYLHLSAEGGEILRIPVRFLKINDDTVLWGAPMELFCEISNEIRDRSPFANTLFIGYLNGTFGYLPNEAEYLAGGYEAKTSPFTASAAGSFTEAVLRHLREIH